jgi:hypothetical protein
MTNPRHRDEVFAYQLVDVEDRIFGPGTSQIMAAFTHINAQGSRFSNFTTPQIINLLKHLRMI